MSTAASVQTRVAKSQPKSNSAHAGLVLQRKCACGSPTTSLTGECAECKSGKRLQTKLAIGASNDPLEQEADRIADHVLAGPSRPTVSSAALRIQRHTPTATGTAGAVPASIVPVLASAGRPLEPALQTDMRQRFGHDFSCVRVHSDALAARSAREVHAQAYTVGSNIVFAAGQFAPGTTAGRRLLAHELTHVVQQSGGELLQRKGGTVGGFFSNFGRSIAGLFGDEPGYDDADLLAYLKILDDTNAIEDDYDSDDKARALVRRWMAGADNFQLTAAHMVLLIREMESGFVSGDDQDQILNVLTLAQNGDLRNIVLAGQIDPQQLEKDFGGKRKQRLLDFYETRFKGGKAALYAGTVEPITGPGSAAPVFKWDWGVFRNKLADSTYLDDELAIELKRLPKLDRDIAIKDLSARLLVLQRAITKADGDQAAEIDAAKKSTLEAAIQDLAHKRRRVDKVMQLAFKGSLDFDWDFFVGKLEDSTYLDSKLKDSSYTDKDLADELKGLPGAYRDTAFKNLTAERLTLQHAINATSDKAALETDPATLALLKLAIQDLTRKRKRVDTVLQTAFTGMVKFDSDFFIGKLEDSTYLDSQLKDFTYFDADLAAELKSLPDADRDLALEALSAERIALQRSLIKTGEDYAAEVDPLKKAALRALYTEISRKRQRVDTILQTAFKDIVLSETPAASLAKTTTPDAAQKAEIKKALKPDVRTSIGGVALPFVRKIVGEAKSYDDKVLDFMPTMIQGYWDSMVKDKEDVDHANPAKVHKLAEFDSIANAAKDAADAVFGAFYPAAAHPPFRSDRSAALGGRGQLHDLFADMKADLAVMGSGSRRSLAKALVFYFFQSNSSIAALNRHHNADPQFDSSGAPVNTEATLLNTIATNWVASAARVKKLNEIDRNWDASASPATREVNIQIFKKATVPEDRTFLWDMYQTLIHEYLHTLVDPAYNTFANSFGGNSLENNTLMEGVDSFLTEIVWQDAVSHVAEPALRAKVEGPTYSALPFDATLIPPIFNRRYASYTQAVKLVNIVGIRNIYAAYFNGKVDLIKP